ncbi:hypothetical protein M9Y10_015512 [Tritrichomonas musculus]|uniref:Uncharacterized protein n=1 Tax=Tritrichomonas musculus TaxID=1915356 RepID=A0ABR2L2G5_9EUKA
MCSSNPINELTFNKYYSPKLLHFQSAVHYIGSSTFQDFSTIAERTIPPSNAAIFDQILMGCSSMKRINSFSSIKTICDSTFSGCFIIKKYWNSF